MNTPLNDVAPAGETIQSSKKVKLLFGQVVSNKCAKSVTVMIERPVPDKLYGKIVSRRKKIMAHCELDIGLGDVVSIASCRPMSKMKRFKVVALVKKAVKK